MGDARYLVRSGSTPGEGSYACDDHGWTRERAEARVYSLIAAVERCEYEAFFRCIARVVRVRGGP